MLETNIKITSSQGNFSVAGGATLCCDLILYPRSAKEVFHTCSLTISHLNLKISNKSLHIG
jgi:hypothetical protein